MENNYIYRITNLVNNKIYIGKTKNPKMRWRQHKCSYTKRNTNLYRAMRKYGFENFKFEILENCNSNEVNLREIYYISKLNPQYNMTLGGDGGGFLNKKHGEYWKEIIKKTKSKKVACYDFDGNLIKVYDSCRDASYELCGKYTRGIDAVARGEYKSYMGFQWKFCEDTPLIKISPHSKNTKTTKIEKYSLIGELIEVYDSMTLAANENEASTSKITLVCQNKRKSHKGFIWRYSAL